MTRKTTSLACFILLGCRSVQAAEQPNIVLIMAGKYGATTGVIRNQTSRITARSVM